MFPGGRNAAYKKRFYRSGIEPLRPSARRHADRKDREKREYCVSRETPFLRRERPDRQRCGKPILIRRGNTRRLSGQGFLRVPGIPRTNANLAAKRASAKVAIVVRRRT